MTNEKNVDPAEKKKLSEEDLDKVSGGDSEVNTDLRRFKAKLERVDRISSYLKEPTDVLLNPRIE